MYRPTLSLILFAAVMLSGCNLETVTVAEASKETKPGPVTSQPKPADPTDEDVVEPVEPAPVEPEPVEPEPVEPAPVEPAPVEPEPVEPEPTEPEPVEPEEKLSVQLAWDIPTQRENGQNLYVYEIGGYKIEYRRVGSVEINYVLIQDGLSDEAEIGDLVKGMYEFRIAAFDVDGLFSDFSDYTTIQVESNS